MAHSVDQRAKKMEEMAAGRRQGARRNSANTEG
jgi:hypothetical protein